MKAFALALLLCAQSSMSQVVRPLPPLPDSVPSVLGYVRVFKVPGLMCAGRPAYGCYSAIPRVIAIRDSMNIVTSWQTLFHEMGHVYLHDGSIHLDEETENRVVDVMATARLAGWLEERRRP